MRRISASGLRFALLVYVYVHSRRAKPVFCANLQPFSAVLTDVYASRYFVAVQSRTSMYVPVTASRIACIAAVLATYSLYGGNLIVGNLIKTIYKIKQKNTLNQVW